VEWQLLHDREKAEERKAEQELKKRRMEAEPEQPEQPFKALLRWAGSLLKK
jgi:hypothetical protein